MLSDAGLSSDFDFDAFDAWANRRENVTSAISWAMFAALAAAYLWWASDGFTSFNAWVGSSLIPLTVVLGLATGLGHAAVTKVSPDHPYLKQVTSYRASLAGYQKAAAEYDDRMRETGLTYWRTMRGVEFEKAVMSFLTRRGCTVEMTKGSGDGGIDLIVRVNGRSFWCQCKGHAAPVSVAPVREIAGVCSRGGATPIMFAVNGYTRAAVSTAAELGVGLVDAPNLVAMAPLRSLSGIG